MRFFLSGEIDAEVGDAFFTTRTKVEERLNALVSGKSYGTAIDLIGIIPVIMDEDSRFRERRFFQRSKRSADYRLHIPYAPFRDGTPRQREKLLAENAVSAILDLSRKAKGARLDFQGERLANDVKKLFGLALQPNSTPHRTRAQSSSSIKRRRARAGERGR